MNNWIQLKDTIVADIRDINCVGLDRTPPSIMVKQGTPAYLLKCWLRGDPNDSPIIVESKYADKVLAALNLEVKEDKNGSPILSVITSDW